MMNARPGNSDQNVSTDPDHSQELYSSLKRYCIFLCQNLWDGEDLAQEAYRKAYEFYGNAISSPLLKKIAHNTWLDLVKKRSRETVGAVPEKKQDTSTSNKDFLELLLKLTPKQAAIFTLKEAFQFKISEIAELFQMSDSAVKAILLRARKRLLRADSDEAIVECIPANRWEALLYEAIEYEDPAELIRQCKIHFKVEKRQSYNRFNSPISSLSMAA